MDQLIDYVGRPVKVGDFLVLGARSGNSGSMYSCLIHEIKTEQVKHRSGDYEEVRVIVRLTSNGRKMTLSPYDLENRAVVIPDYELFNPTLQP